MADHLSDEEQLEALKRWWKQNGTSLVLVVAIVVGGWSGWHYWQDRQKQQAENASTVFMAMIDASTAWEQEPTEENASAVLAQAEILKKLGDGNQYARYAALTVAKLAAADGDYDNAAAELEAVQDNTGDEAMDALVRLRLASVELARGNQQRALELVQEPYPPQFNSLFQELKGDIFAAQGEEDKARDAYELALSSLGSDDPRAKMLLELKANEVASVTTSQGSEEQENAE